MFITWIPNYASVLAGYYTYQTNQCTHIAKLENIYNENSLSKYSKCHTCNSVLITSLVSCIVFLRFSPPSSNFKPVIFPLQAPFLTMTVHVFFPDIESQLFPYGQQTGTLGSLVYRRTHTEDSPYLGDWSWGMGLEWRLLNEAQPFWYLRVILSSNIPDSLLIYSVNVCILSSRMCPLFRSEILICFVTDLSLVARLMLITLQVLSRYLLSVEESA